MKKEDISGKKEACCSKKHAPKIIEINDPKESVIKLAAKSVLVERQEHGKDSDHFRTVVLRLFTVNNPHKEHNIFPTHVIRFSNVEKVRIRRLNVSYYMEGPHIVINDLEELYLTREDHKLIIKGYQIEVEKRTESP
ncbi:MAG TPA: hypothetical protein VJ461_05120 [Candidatus Nanoarchaeia archaeon]|nr:hypothetical protein [Candidatus Nanoarchaeia archaeon]